MKKQSTKQCGLRDVYMHRKTGMARCECNSESVMANFFFSCVLFPTNSSVTNIFYNKNNLLKKSISWHSVSALIFGFCIGTFNCATCFI